MECLNRQAFGTTIPSDEVEEAIRASFMDQHGVLWNALVPISLATEFDGVVVVRSIQGHFRHQVTAYKRAIQCRQSDGCGRTIPGRDSTRRQPAATDQIG